MATTLPTGAQSPDTIADAVYGQAGSFLTSEENHGGLSENSLGLPLGIAPDSSGNLYVCDSLNHRVLFYPAGPTTATRVYGQSGSFSTHADNDEWGEASAETLARILQDTFELSAAGSL